MRQLGAAITILALIPALLAGCSDDTQEAARTGIELSFTDCLTFGVWVFVEGEYQGLASTEEPSFFDLAPGSYEIYLRSNAKLGEDFFCWTDNISVSDGSMTSLTYSCDGAQCQD